MTQDFNLIGPTAVDGNQDRIYRTLPDDPHGLGDRIPVHQRKAAAASGFDSSPFSRQQHRCDCGRALI
jgi:hypothetical protein